FLVVRSARAREFVFADAFVHEGLALVALEALRLRLGAAGLALELRGTRRRRRLRVATRGELLRAALEAGAHERAALLALEALFTRVRVAVLHAQLLPRERLAGLAGRLGFLRERIAGAERDGAGEQQRRDGRDLHVTLLP